MEGRKFKFGLKEFLKDYITGFEGVVVARTQYLTGCNHYSLQNRDQRKDGKPIDWESFDETRLSRIEKPKKEKPRKYRGGPVPKIEKW